MWQPSPRQTQQNLICWSVEYSGNLLINYSGMIHNLWGYALNTSGYCWIVECFWPESTSQSNECYRDFLDQIFSLISESWSRDGELPWELHWGLCAKKKSQVKGYTIWINPSLWLSSLHWMLMAALFMWVTDGMQSPGFLCPTIKTERSPLPLHG